MKKILVAGGIIVVTIVGCAHPDTSNVPAGKDSMRVVGAPDSGSYHPDSANNAGDTGRHL